MIPPGVDLNAIAPVAPSGRQRPVVVHAPSSRRRKGTEHVLAACAELDVDLRIVEGLHHDEALEHYRDADIVVDQLNAGWYGLFAIECMALGKPVVTFLHDEAVRRTEEAFDIRVPIVNATADTLRERLDELVSLGIDGREEVGRASRAYVERVHDLERVTDRLVDLYAAVLEPSPGARTPWPSRPLRPRRPGRRCRSGTPTSTRSVPARVAAPRDARAGTVGLGSAAPPARPALRDLRDRRARLARHRRAAASRLHALPQPDRLRADRDAPRADDGDGARAPGGDHERLLPLLLRRDGRRRASPRAADVVLVHDGRRHARARAPAPARGARLVAPLRDRRRGRSRPRSRRRALGDRQLRAADRALPGRGAVGRVRLREPREHLPHDRPHASPRRRLRPGAARRDRRQPQRDAHRLPLAARLPAGAARARVRPRPAAGDEPLRGAARADGALPLGDELQRPLLPRQARRRGRGRRLLGRRADRVGDGAASDRVPHRVARVRVLDPRRGRGTPDVRLRAHVPHRRHRLGRARAEPARPVARRPAGRRRRSARPSRRRRAARVLGRRVRGVHRRRDRRRARHGGRSSTGSSPGSPRSSTSRSTSR